MVARAQGRRYKRQYIIVSDAQQTCEIDHKLGKSSHVGLGLTFVDPPLLLTLAQICVESLVMRVSASLLGLHHHLTCHNSEIVLVEETLELRKACRSQSASIEPALRLYLPVSGVITDLDTSVHGRQPDSQQAPTLIPHLRGELSHT